MDTQLLEAQLLFSVIFTPEWIDLLTLEEVDFTSYRPVFKALMKLKAEGKTIDHTAVQAIEKTTKDMSDIVLSSDNNGMTIIPLKSIFEERIDLLRELSAKRQIKASFVNELDLDVLKEKLDQIHKKGSSRWLTGEDIKNLAYEILKDKKENSVTYGLSILDKATKGIGRGQYIIVAGRPSVGKSAYLQYLGLKNAEKGKKVLFVSAEMSEEMIISRIMTTYGPETIPSTFNILIAGDTGTIEAEINKKARDFDLILVDYIQLLKSKGRTKDLYERVTEISGDLKGMATKFNLPFICASQFSRAAEGNQPNMAHLKESGALEQDADVVISLWKDKKDADFTIDKTLSKIRLDLLKNRNGWTFANSDTNIYAVMFKKNEFRFYDVDKTERSEK
jgi:replicative DNA helicase